MANTYIQTPKFRVKAKSQTQADYMYAMENFDINFAIGSAGSGKSLLSVAYAVNQLMAKQVDRMVLVRPAVEAGEKLGFLPGDLNQKIDPYLRPLYDALYLTLGVETVKKLTERQQIEVAPLAFMRGRTLNNAVIILDEAQNTTIEQMKMFLTRMGYDSKVLITGDPSQIDLPKHITSGLTDAVEVLHNVKGVGFTDFTSRDVVRHPLVRRIVDAYHQK